MSPAISQCRLLWLRRMLMTFLSLCVFLLNNAIAQLTDSLPGPKIIKVDGRDTRVQSAGLESRKDREPVVVFEAGLSNSLDVWAAVLPEVARFAPVVAYDRAGLGKSAWDEQDPTPYHVIANLRKLLLHMDVAPPYLLVGYSWGGSLMRYYAGYYPDEVSGIVYIDPGPIVTQSFREELAPFDSVGAGKAGYDAFWSGFAKVFDKSSPAVKKEFEAMRNVMEQPMEKRGLKPVPPVPATVIVSAKPYPFFLELPYDQEAHYRADVRHRVKVLQEWALESPDGTLVVSNSTTHAIPREDPDLIVGAIRRMLGR